MRVLSLVNQKGGCGKTTVAIHLAGALAQRGDRVLLVDLDPQAHASLGLGVDCESSDSLAEVLSGDAGVKEALRETPGGIRLLPGSERLAEFEEVSARSFHPEHALRSALQQIASDFDWALLDCPARADGVLTANALCASTCVFLVVETGAFALQGAVRALRLVDDIAERQGSSFDVRVLGTLFDRRTRYARELLVALQARFGSQMFDTVIRSSVRLREASACGVPVQILDSRSRATADFEALAEEVCGMRDVRGLPIRQALGLGRSSGEARLAPSSPIPLPGIR